MLKRNEDVKNYGCVWSRFWACSLQDWRIDVVPGSYAAPGLFLEDWNIDGRPGDLDHRAGTLNRFG